jgi:hypothetical protein
MSRGLVDPAHEILWVQSWGQRNHFNSENVLGPYVLFAEPRFSTITEQTQPVLKHSGHFAPIQNLPDVKYWVGQNRLPIYNVKSISDNKEKSGDLVGQ